MFLFLIYLSFCNPSLFSSTSFSSSHLAFHTCIYIPCLPQSFLPHPPTLFLLVAGIPHLYTVPHFLIHSYSLPQPHLPPLTKHSMSGLSIPFPHTILLFCFILLPLIPYFHPSTSFPSSTSFFYSPGSFCSSFRLSFFLVSLSFFPPSVVG